ncbi:MAG: GNAT family N-acetyltransferase [Lacipirellulaceae bacterium]
MIVLEYPYGSAPYRAALALRDRFLRRPLGMVLSEADTAGEESQLHYGLFATDPSVAGERAELFGSAIALPLPAEGPGVVRLRQVVIDEARRGQGLGRLLMAGIERDLAAKGYRRVTLWARPEAAPFYAKCGYTPTGAVKTLVGMAHGEYAKGIG